MILNFLAVLTLVASYTCKPGEVLTAVNIQGSDVTLSDCRIRESGAGANAISVYGNRSTLRRLTVERAGAAGIAYFAGVGHVLEDSTIRDPARRSGMDSWAIYSSGGSVTIRRNVVFGSGFSAYAPGATFLIERNRFVIPDDYRTDCNGRIQRDGPCQCGEFGIALKSGGAIIRRNTISGFRRSDPYCGGSGTPGAGIATAACGPQEVCPTAGVVIDRNEISDSTHGLYTGPTTTNLTVTGNWFCRNGIGIQDGFSTGRIADNMLDNTIDLNVYGPTTLSNNRMAVCP